MLTLVQIPCLKDNSAWLVVHDDEALVVDPPEAAPVLLRLASTGARLVAVVNTHHHADHVGGNLELVAQTGCAVVGNAHDAARIPGLTSAVLPGHTTQVAGIDLRVLDVSAHTRGHVAYASHHRIDAVLRRGHGGEERAVAALSGRPLLFVGDALFGAGCGRLFEGTREMLERSLRALAGCDRDSIVCCAHEYTGANLRFACHALPGHAAIQARAAALDGEMAETHSSLPFTLAGELATNPFLLALDASDPVAAVGDLRARKDVFQG